MQARSFRRTADASAINGDHRPFAETIRDAPHSPAAGHSAMRQPPAARSCRNERQTDIRSEARSGEPHAWGYFRRVSSRAAA